MLNPGWKLKLAMAWEFHAGKERPWTYYQLISPEGFKFYVERGYNGGNLPIMRPMRLSVGDTLIPVPKHVSDEIFRLSAFRPIL